MTRRNPNFDMNKMRYSEVAEECPTLLNYIRRFKNLLYLKALFYFLSSRRNRTSSLVAKVQAGFDGAFIMRDFDRRKQFHRVDLTRAARSSRTANGAD